MAQDTINERIKFLIDRLGTSVRAFSELVGEQNSNVNNYVGERQSMPPVTFLEKIINHIENINPMWLITGRGEPFTGSPPNIPPTIKGKKNKVGVAGTNNGISIGNLTFDDCKQALAISQLEVEHLRDKLQDKDELLKAKEDTIRLLRARFGNPN